MGSHLFQKLFSAPSCFTLQMFFIADIYFYIILMQLVEEEGKASAASEPDPPAKRLPFRIGFSPNVSHDFSFL